MGTAALVAEYDQDLDTATVVMSTPSSITSSVSDLVWKAKNNIRNLGKARAISHLAKNLNTLTSNTLSQPHASAHQLIHLAFQSDSQTSLDIQIKNLLAPDQDFTRKCHSCALCIDCIELEDLPAKEKETKPV